MTTERNDKTSLPKGQYRIIPWMLPLILNLLLTVNIGLDVAPTQAPMAQTTSWEPRPQRQLDEYLTRFVETQLELHGPIIHSWTDDGTLVYSKNPDRRIPPASLTKLLTAYVALDYIEDNQLSLDSYVSIDGQALASSMPADASRVGIQNSWELNYRDLLRATLIVSGNDASYALAFSTYGYERFIEEMNATAADLGMTDSSFVEPSGYSELNVTTAQDMALLIDNYVLRFSQTLEEFSASETLTLSRVSSDQLFRSRNRNGLVLDDERFVGLKTGFINESGYHLAARAHLDNGMVLNTLVMGIEAPNSIAGSNLREADAKAITDLVETMELVQLGIHAPASQRVYGYTEPFLVGSAVVLQTLIPSQLVDSLSSSAAFTYEKGRWYQDTRLSDGNNLNLHLRQELELTKKAYPWGDFIQWIADIFHTAI